MRIVTALVGLAILAGCGGTNAGAADVATYRGNAARTGEMPGPGPSGQPGIAWEFQAGGSISSSPAVVDDTVFIASGDGIVHALRLDTGSQVWDSDLHASVGSASPLVIDGKVIVGDTAGVLHALDATTGKERWRRAVDGPITGAVAAAGHTVVTATGAGTALGLDSETGEVSWQTTLPQGVAKSVALMADHAYLGAGGTLIALAIDDGRIDWSAQMSSDGDVGTPTVAGGLVFAGVGLGAGDPAAMGIVALDAASGAVRWRYASPTQAQMYTPAVVDGQAYGVGHDNAVVALVAATGELVWRTDTGAVNEALPAVASRVVYVPTNGGNVQALDAPTGTVLWRAGIIGVPYAPVVTSGLVLVGTSTGALFALGAAQP